MDQYQNASPGMDGMDLGSLITPKQLAERLGISLKWVEKHTQERRIPGQVKVGRVWRYEWVEIQKRIITGEILLEKPKRGAGH